MTAPGRAGAGAAGLLVLLLGSSLLSGCAIFHKKKPVACPGFGILGDADKITHFTPRGQDITDIDYRATVAGLGGSCASADDGQAIEMKVSIKLLANRGPALTGDQIGVPYFVSVIDRRDQKILAKATFVSPIKFAAGHAEAGVVEKVSEHIPLAPGAHGPDYEILVGFQLTQTELDYNRTHPGQ